MAKYLKKFDTTAEYQAYITGSSVPNPNVCWCVDENSVYYNPYIPPQSNNEIWYTTTNGKIVTPFGAKIISNTYSGGKGVIKFDGPVTKIGELAFSSISTLQSISIPDGVKSIGINAFNGCSSLTSFNIPDSVTKIDTWAFQNCSSLNEVICLPTTPPTIGSNPFNTDNDYPIYVPAESVEAYKTASVWSKYASRIQAMP